MPRAGPSEAQIASAAPRVSVVIPVYDLERFVGEAVDSVLDQTFPAHEMILVDDGSQDGSGEIIRGYQERNPGRVRGVFVDHRGAATARNVGIAAARGEWIAFLDGDDLWRPEKLARQLDVLAAHPECDFVATGAEVLGEGRPWHALPDHVTDLGVELLRRGCFLTLSSVVVRRELVAATGFDERLEGAQDLDLFFRLADRVHPRFLPAPLVLYRLRPDAISAHESTRYLQLLRHFQVARRELARIESQRPEAVRPHRAEVRRTLARLAHEAAYHALASRHASVATRLALAAGAVARDPLATKNLRFLVQCLLPARANRWLAERRGRP